MFVDWKTKRTDCTTHTEWNFAHTNMDGNGLEDNGALLLLHQSFFFRSRIGYLEGLETGGGVCVSVCSADVRCVIQNENSGRMCRSESGINIECFQFPLRWNVVCVTRL